MKLALILSYLIICVSVNLCVVRGNVKVMGQCRSWLICNATGGGEATVCKLQVGLLGSARGLQKDLEKIAGRADTNTPDGLHYVLQGMTILWQSTCLFPKLCFSA